MHELLSHPWPWYVAGPIIGAIVPLLLVVGGRHFGISSNLRHLCAACGGGWAATLFRHDWKRDGAWNLVFAAGLVLGGGLASTFLSDGSAGVVVADATRRDLAMLGITEISGLVPPQLASWEALFTVRGAVMLVGGGFLVGFGTRWAGGCTSGHAIAGTAHLQVPSLVAVLGFFGGGLVMTHLLLPFVLGA